MKLIFAETDYILFIFPNKQGWIGVLILGQNKNRPTLSKGKTPGLYLRMILACYFCTFTNADKSYGETGGAFVVDYFVTSLRIWLSWLESGKL